MVGVDMLSGERLGVAEQVVLDEVGSEVADAVAADVAADEANFSR